MLRALIAIVAFAVFSTLGARASAQQTTGPGREEPLLGSAIPDLGEAPSLEGLAGKPIRRIEVTTWGGRWASSPRVTGVREGEPLSLEAARRAMRELLAGGASFMAMKMFEDKQRKEGKSPQHSLKHDTK